MSAEPVRPLVSVIIPTRNEEAHLGACLESVLQSGYPRERMEILVVDGQSDDRTRDIVAALAERHPHIRLLDNPGRIVPTALNLAIRVARGEVIIRMDAHVLYPPDYIPRLVAELEQSGADNVGGRIVTSPADATPTAQAIALGMSHPLGVGNSHFRIGTAQRRWVDTVPFGCYRREVFDRIGLFDEELVRGQDEELNFRLLRAGGRILLLPEVYSLYFTRASLPKLARMFYQYGFFKPLVGTKVGRIMTVRQLVPALFLVSLLGSALLAPLLPAAALLLLGIVGAYAVVVVGCAVPAAWRRGVRCAALLALVFPVIHFGYGIGFLRGAAALPLRAVRPRPAAAAIPLSR